MKVLDWIFAVLALLAFAGFLAILIWFVPKPGLVIVCVVSIGLCAYDFARSGFLSERRRRSVIRESGL
jgi:hypothetical protein